MFERLAEKNSEDQEPTKDVFAAAVEQALLDESEDMHQETTNE